MEIIFYIRSFWCFPPQGILNDFAARCGGIFQESVKWAAQGTRSVIQQYLLHLESTAGFGGVERATESALQFAGVNKRGSDKGENFVSSMSLRSRYAGEVSFFRHHFLTVVVDFTVIFFRFCPLIFRKWYP